jgi:hypothetical protein
MREMQRGESKVRVKWERCRGGWLNVILELEKIVFILAFFLSAGWLNQFGSVRFNRFQTLKTESNRTRILLWFFNRLIRFFFSVRFFRLFFFQFSRFNWFIGFFAHP